MSEPRAPRAWSPPALDLTPLSSFHAAVDDDGADASCLILYPTRFIAFTHPQIPTSSASTHAHPQRARDRLGGSQLAPKAINGNRARLRRRLTVQASGQTPSPYTPFSAASHDREPVLPRKAALKNDSLLDPVLRNDLSSSHDRFSTKPIHLSLPTRLVILYPQLPSWQARRSSSHHPPGLHRFGAGPPHQCLLRLPTALREPSSLNLTPEPLEAGCATSSTTHQRTRRLQST